MANWTQFTIHLETIIELTALWAHPQFSMQINMYRLNFIFQAYIYNSAQLNQHILSMSNPHLALFMWLWLWFHLPVAAVIIHLRCNPLLIQGIVFILSVRCHLSRPPLRSGGFSFLGGRLIVFRQIVFIVIIHIFLCSCFGLGGCFLGLRCSLRTTCRPSSSSFLRCGSVFIMGCLIRDNGTPIAIQYTGRFFSIYLLSEL